MQSDDRRKYLILKTDLGSKEMPCEVCFKVVSQGVSLGGIAEQEIFVCLDCLKQAVHVLEELDTSVKYVGWIHGQPSDLERLRELGVKGEMIYNPERNCFEYCETDEETMERLRAEYKGFYPGAFTAVNGSNCQLPHEQQKYWGLTT